MYCGSPDILEPNCIVNKIDTAIFKENFNDVCVNKKKCSINAHRLHTDIHVEDECDPFSSRVYIQYKCDIEQDIKEHHQIYGAIIAQIGIVICLSFSYTIYEAQQSDKINIQL